MNNPEIIKFERPSRESAIYLQELPSTFNVDELYERLLVYGLIFSIYINPSPPSSLITWGTVVFYSVQSAHQCLKGLSETRFQGYQIHAKFAKNEENPNYSNLSLSLPKCIELANHYLGFNGWSSQILDLSQIRLEECTDHDQILSSQKNNSSQTSSQKVSDEITDQEGKSSSHKLFLCSYSATVRITFHVDQPVPLSVTENEVYEELGAEPYELLGKTKKCAVSYALKKAFQSVVLIKLSSGRVVVHHLQSSIEDYWSHNKLRNSLWEQLNEFL